MGVLINGGLDQINSLLLNFLNHTSTKNRKKKESKKAKSNDRVQS
jgi:hypothetical protein